MMYCHDAIWLTVSPCNRVGLFTVGGAGNPGVSREGTGVGGRRSPDRSGQARVRRAPRPAAQARIKAAIPVPVRGETRTDDAESSDRETESTEGSRYRIEGFGSDGSIQSEGVHLVLVVLSNRRFRDVRNGRDFALGPGVVTEFRGGIDGGPREPRGGLAR